MSEDETMKQAWAVSSGSYSDYHVICVCDSKERAEKVAALLSATSRYDDAVVESFPLVDSETKRITWCRFSAVVWDDGRVTDEIKHVESHFDFEVEQPGWLWVRAPLYRGQGGRLEVWGQDKERVTKVFSDRKAQAIADDAFRMATRREGRLPRRPT